jgi:hypothetical protein
MEIFMKPFRLFVCSSLSLLWLQALTAGVLMVNTQEFLEGSKKPTTSKLRVESDRVRIETGETSGSDVIIFRGDQQVLWIIDNKAKAYREMTKAGVERLGGQVNNLMAKMQEQIKNMPPQQRQMVEKMMKSRMGGMTGGAQPARTEYTKVAGGQKLNQWTCDKYEGVREGEKRREVWTTAPDQLGLEMSDFKVMQQMREFFESFSKFGSEAPFRVGSLGAEQEGDYSGMPVRQIFYKSGRPSMKTEINEVRREEFDASLFELPEGYKKLKMIEMPGGKRKSPLQR